MDCKYPVRCRILNVDGGDFHGIPIRTPEEILPYIGELGMAYDTEDGVEIILDNGAAIYGYECWWEPVEEYPA